MTTLFINRNDSRCGNCNGNADLSEEAHLMETMKGKGCGEVFTHVSSNYFGMDSQVKSMRPDLPFLEPGI